MQYIKSAILFVFIVTIVSNCTSNSTGNEEPSIEVDPTMLPPFETSFAMVVNGENWENSVPPGYENSSHYMIPLARLSGMEENEGDTLFQITNFKHQVAVSVSTISSYYDFVGFFDVYVSGQEDYPVSHRGKIEGVDRGFTYGEYVGGDDIIYYYPIDLPTNSFSVEFKHDEFGRKFVEGSFTVTVVVDSSKTDSLYLPFRSRPDTLIITDGTFKLDLKTD